MTPAGVTNAESRPTDETGRTWEETVALTNSEGWPTIPVAAWQDTRDTLHLYTQVVGKVRLANEPRVNHWWNTPLYVSARGLTTSLMPHPTGPAFQIDLDLVDHRLDIVTVAGQRRSLDLVPRSVAEFYQATMSMLVDLGMGTDIWPMPVEIPGAIAFPDDRVHASYDADAVRWFWLALVKMERVFKVFRARFVGKSSPVHLFWSLKPYAERSGRDTTNGNDEIFPTGGAPAVLDVTPDGGGYRAVIGLLLPTASAPS